MKNIKYYLGVLLVFILAQSGLSQESCFKKLRDKGRYLLFEKEEYPAALGCFLAAQSCWDKKSEDEISLLIDSTFSIWTSKLDVLLDREKELKEKAADLAREEARLKVLALQDASENFAFRLAYESQRALEEDKMAEAFNLAQRSWGRIRSYNENALQKNWQQLGVPPFIVETYGNAFFYEKKIDIETGHENITAFGKAQFGGRFFTIGEDQKVKIWDQDGQILDSCVILNDYILSATISNDGNRIILGLKNNKACLWTGVGKEPQYLKEHTGAVIQAEFLRNGKIITISRDGVARIWDAQGQEILFEKKFPEPLLELKILQDDQSVILRSAYNLYSWNWNRRGEEGEPIILALNHRGSYIYDSSISPKENLILGLMNDDEVRVYNLERNERVPNLTMGNIQRAKFNPYNDEGQIALASKSGEALLFNQNGQNIKPPIDLHDGEVTKIEFSYNGLRQLSMSRDSSFVIWDRVPFRRHHKSQIVSVEFSPSQFNLLLSCTEMGEAKLWSPSGNLLMKMSLLDDGFIATFSEDGNRIFMLTKHGKLTFCPLPIFEYDSEI